MFQVGQNGQWMIENSQERKKKRRDEEAPESQDRTQVPVNMPSVSLSVHMTS